MATAQIWPGSSSFASGNTPFGLYDTDMTFTASADNTAAWCAKRLGYPIVDVELQAENFYACFEEAVTEYGAQVNYMNIKNNLFVMQGQTTGSNLSQRNIKPTADNIVRISEQYGSEVGVGGSIDWRSGSIDVSQSVQVYLVQPPIT